MHLYLVTIRNYSQCIFAVILSFQTAYCNILSFTNSFFKDIFLYKHFYFTLLFKSSNKIFKR